MELVPNKKQLSHRRIVDAAARAMRRGGFAGVGVADVMKEAGLTHGGFYAHFDSREALLTEALTRAGEDSAADLARRAEPRRAHGASPFRALIESYLADTHLANAESGCPVAALLSEVPRQSEELQHAALQRMHSLVAAIRDALVDPQQKDQAIVIAATLVGALQIARALGDNAQGKSVLAAARHSLLAAHDAA